jgi:p-hydroxybenzoate 3-monooxygenase
MPDNCITRVVILGAGPAGLALGNLLHARQVPCIVVDKFTREQLVGRAGAGLLEHRTVATFEQMGLAKRLFDEAHRHTGMRVPLRGPSKLHRPR